MNKKKKANNKSSTSITEGEKVRTFYRDHKMGMQVPVTENFVNALIVRMYAWATDNPRAIRISKFTALEGIPRQTFYDWFETFPRLKDAYADIKIMMADRLLDGAIFLKDGMRDGPCLRYIHLYDPELKAAEEWRAKLKDPEQGTEARIVVIEKYPDSPLVPKKEEK